MNSLVAPILNVLVTPELQSLVLAEMKLTGRSPCEVVSDAAVNWLRSRRQRRHIPAEATACAVAQAGSVSDLHE